MRQFIGEAFGMFILLSFGLSSCAQNLFVAKKDPNNKSDLSINLAFGFGATNAGLVCGKISGNFKKKNYNFFILSNKYV